MTAPKSAVNRRRHARLGLAATLLAVSACSESGPAAAPPKPGSPGPSLYLADQFTGTQRAARAVADAGTVWLLDAAGDFVFGIDPAHNWTGSPTPTRPGGLALSWRQVPGAAKYRVMGRNTAAAPTDWKDLLALPAPDPVLYPTVVALGVNPWSAGLGTGGNPWSFGNHIQLAVAALDGGDAMVAGGLSDPLDLADGFPGLLSSLEIDRPGLAVPFDPGVERGATFRKTIRLSFSEPMSTAAAPALVSQSANLAIRRVLAGAWGADAGTPSASPPSAAAHAFLLLELAVKGACAEIRVGRGAGDLLLVVSDVTRFSTGSTAGVLFLDGDTGALLAETLGVTAVEAATGRITLGAPLATDVPAGALACAVPGSTFPVPRLVAEAGTRLTVSDATPFFTGEKVAVHQPPVPPLAAVHDVRTVAGVDTVAGILVLSELLSAGHQAGAWVVPLNGLGGEVALRPSAPLVLQRDATGGQDAELFLSGPTSAMVGDLVLVDADGLVQTTTDQAQAAVKQVRFAPDGAGPFSVVLDLPPAMTLLHGRAVAIGMGDSFAVGGTQDTSAAVPTPLDPHGDQFSPDGRFY